MKAVRLVSGRKGKGRGKLREANLESSVVGVEYVGGVSDGHIGFSHEEPILNREPKGKGGKKNRTI
jgi:hypothetical protein